MGCGPSKVQRNVNSRVDHELSVASITITKQLEQEQEEEKRVIKCLLLGAGECGKSTILKQMRILHLNGFNSPDERATYRALILKNTLDSIQALAAAMDQLAIPYEKPDNKSRAEKLLSIPSNSSSIDLSIKSDIENVWYDGGIQRAVSRNNEFHLLDSAPYFFEHLDRIFSPKYDPTEQDILRSRLSTTGIIETMFKMDRLMFKMYDVGGQRGERKKWIHCFDNVTAILFIASLSEYDMVLIEDRTRNRMKESMDLFEGINNLPWFRDIPIILFLNKDDIFRAKVVNVDIGIYFPQYTGGLDYNAGLQFIQNEYFDRNGNQSKQIYCHVTDATNTENIAFVWKAAKHIILEQSLNVSGMMM